ncbi:MAG: VWA domain-containing protein, partial [candidate division Zixibacteria bacterium]|nr:VWA domain-containing protein [candidate division Zixibacteria bacterium]
MYLRYRNVWCLAALVLLATMFGALSSFAGIDPPTLTATLNPTESIGEAKTVDMPGVIPQGDIMFSFDLTGSMGGAINTAKAEAINIMNALDALIADSRFGVISYMDYPASYSYCGYGATYGYSSYGDYAYSLDIPASMDRTAVAATINGLVLGYGGDGPQDYTRPFYESYADAAIGYRPGAKKILLNFGDNVPHDCDINEGVPGASGTYSTGGDPGRDEIIGTADDLDLQTVLADMADNDVTLLEIHTHSGYANYWQHWTAITGGEHYVLGSTSDIPSAIFELIQAQALEISELTLEVTTPGYEGWLVSVDPPMYADL